LVTKSKSTNSIFTNSKKMKILKKSVKVENIIMNTKILNMKDLIIINMEIR